MSGLTCEYAAAPVARDRSEGGEPCFAAVACDTKAVHARAAHDRHAPAGVRACAQHGERVVPHPGASRPAAPDGQLLECALLVGEVDARQEQQRLRRLLSGRELRDQAADDVECGLGAEMVGGAPTAAHSSEHGAVVAHERNVGLRVSAVDRECEPHRGTPASRSAASRSASTWATWPMSGCASSALRAVTGSRVIAASAASRS